MSIWKKIVPFSRIYLIGLIDLYNSEMNITIANGIKKPDMVVSACREEKPLLSK
jgi:hypothetical protein